MMEAVIRQRCAGARTMDQKIKQAKSDKTLQTFKYQKMMTLVVWYSRDYQG